MIKTPEDKVPIIWTTRGMVRWLFFISILFSGINVTGQQLSLKVAGNEQDGFYVEVYNRERLIISNTEEFSLHMSNLDNSTVCNMDHWKGKKWSGDNNSIILTGDSYLPEFDANLSVRVTYNLVNSNVIQKRVELFQPSMPGMYYIFKQTVRPAEVPTEYVTFEHDKFPGGFVHEIYPSAGFITPDNFVVGVLTDAGYLNHYTRNTRRRFSGRGGGFVGMRILPDVNLLTVADINERKINNHFISQTFGEMVDLDVCNQLTLESPLNTLAGREIVINEGFRVEGTADVVNDKGLLTIHGYPDSRSGIELIVPFKDQRIYTISFLCKGNTPVALKLFRIKNGNKTYELEHGIKYIDNFPVKENEWTEFKGSILIPYIENDSISMFLGSQSGKEFVLQIKDLQFTEHQFIRTAENKGIEPYNLLPQGDTVTKTTFLFIEPWQSHQQFMISSQTRLAEGKGFEGTLAEKMLYGNFNMLTWITDVRDFTPFNVPNMNYAPDMYNRDSFFAIVSTYNRELNLGIWEKWGKTQTTECGIGTIITPYMGSVEAKDNEATIEWLMWALLNKRRFGAVLPKDKIKKAVEYVLNEFDADKDGKCTSHFSLSQIDIVDFQPKTDRLAVNQGMFAVALRTIKELGYDIRAEYVERAEAEYRSFYDSKRKHMIFDKNFPDIICLNDLEPEFYSLWLFNRPILTDEMVINHLEQTPLLNKVPGSPHPEIGTTAPILVRLIKEEPGYSYLTEDYQPFAEFGEINYSKGKNEGFYYNGGSWLRAEYCAYVTGLRHGWEKATPVMENRVWAEIYLNPEWPYSKEFIPTKWNSTNEWWVSTRGLCWNVFLLMANEVAGIRTPTMDPDYGK